MKHFVNRPRCSRGQMNQTPHPAKKTKKQKKKKKQQEHLLFIRFIKVRLFCWAQRARTGFFSSFFSHHQRILMLSCSLTCLHDNASFCLTRCQWNERKTVQCVLNVGVGGGGGWGVEGGVQWSPGAPPAAAGVSLHNRHRSLNNVPLPMTEHHQNVELSL